MDRLQLEPGSSSTLPQVRHYQRKDLSERDGTHPSEPWGREKVAGLLLKFFKTDPTARSWFTHAPAGD